MDLLTLQGRIYRRGNEKIVRVASRTRSTRAPRRHQYTRHRHPITSLPTTIINHFELVKRLNSTLGRNPSRNSLIAPPLCHYSLVTCSPWSFVVSFRRSGFCYQLFCAVLLHFIERSRFFQWLQPPVKERQRYRLYHLVFSTTFPSFKPRETTCMLTQAGLTTAMMKHHVDFHVASRRS